jgi:HEAT repeat protein
MRVSWLLILCALPIGCTAKQPLTVHYQPVGYWIQVLQNRDPKMRLKAVRALANVGTADPAALPALIKAVKDADAGVRAEAILALLRMGPDAGLAVPALTAALNDEDSTVQSYAAKALQRIQGVR